MALGPRAFGQCEPTAMAQQEVRESVARPPQVGADVFSTPKQIACGLFLLGGNVNRSQRAGAIQHRELTGVPAIGLDAIARTAGNEAGGNHIAWDAACRHGPLEFKAARASFVAAGTAPSRRRRSMKRRMVGLSDVNLWSAGVRCPGSSTAATVVAAC
jgi:hypothetical protein